MEELLNNFPEFVFMGSVLWFYIITLTFIVVLFVSEVNENGYYALASFVIFSLVMRFWGNFDIMDYFSFTLLGIYLGVGFIHSLLRTYFFGRKTLVYNGYLSSSVPASEKDIEENIEGQIKNRKSKLKGNVFRWWFLFPISFLTWVFSDLLKDFFETIYSKLRKLYEYILDLGLKGAK